MVFLLEYDMEWIICFVIENNNEVNKKDVFLYKIFYEFKVLYLLFMGEIFEIKVWVNY